uniref:Fibrinogen C-terminal domain-containing protein n=1 Tax=Heligmosomoides polygyrus TaxID=6339 RepID=A0A183F1Y8_HELPZ
LTGLRHEKMNTQPSGTCRDDRLTGLIYDPDFDCYYNPMDDQYYKVQPSESGEHLDDQVCFL